MLQRIGGCIARDAPPDIAACEICRKIQCANDEWIVCERRIAHAKCLEEIENKKRS